MEIIINKNNASEYILETNKILWKHGTQKTRLFFVIQFLIGILLLCQGLNDDFESITSSSKYVDKTFVTNTEITQNNYHFTVGLGSSFILFSLYVAYIYLVRQKRKFFKTVKKISELHKLKDDNYTIKITEKSSFYQDYQITKDVKWSLISEYKIYKEYLFLFHNDLDSAFLIIARKEIANKDFTELLMFLKNRLIERK